MSISLLEKIQLLPPDKQEFAKDFIEVLLSKYKIEDTEVSENLVKQEKGNINNRNTSKTSNEV